MAGVTIPDAMAFRTMAFRTIAFGGVAFGVKAPATKALEGFASMIRFVARGGHHIIIIGF
jgi:hypothetical protein